MTHKDKLWIGSFGDNWNDIFNPHLPRCPECGTRIKEDRKIVRCPECYTELKRYIREDVTCVRCGKTFWRNIDETRTMCGECNNSVSLNSEMTSDGDGKSQYSYGRKGYCVRCEVPLEYKKRYLTGILERYKTSIPAPGAHYNSYYNYYPIEEAARYNKKYFMPCNNCATQQGRNKIDGRYIGEMLIDCRDNYSHKVLNSREEFYG